MIKPEYKDIAKEAGFAFWGNESWGPGEGCIDWSLDYDIEFNKFADILLSSIGEQDNQTDARTNQTTIRLTRVEIERLYFFTKMEQDCLIFEVTSSDQTGIGSIINVDSKPAFNRVKNTIDITDTDNW